MHHIVTLWTGARVLLLGLGLLLALVRAEFFVPEDVPGPPEKIFVSPASDTSIRVQFSKPLNVKPEGVNGAPVLGYKVEVARRIDEVQTFSVVANGPILAGGYKVTFTNHLGSEVTLCIPWNASDVEFETALEQLPNVDSVAVSRSFYNAAKNGFVYTITFDGAYLVSGQQSNLLTGSTTGCQATRPPNRVLSFEGAHGTTGVSGFYPEVWEIISTDSSNMKVLGGMFDLSVGFEGDWVDTNPGITADVAPGTRTVKTSASMLGRVNRGDRVRIKGEEFTVHATAPFTDSELPLDSYHIRGAADAAIELMDTALGNVQVTKTSNLITTSSDFSLKIAVDEEIQIGAKVFKVTNIATNSMTLDATWTGDTTLHITAFARKKTTVSVNVEANEMKRALGALPGAGSIDVSRIGPTRTNGYRWYVTFQSLDNVNLRVDKQPGAMKFVDVYGAVCSTCTVTASVIKDETFVTTLTGIQGDYAANAIVASQEVSGVINEVQTISTTATADDISGSFAVSFQSVGGAMINFDDTAADVRTKLQNLATVGRLNVTRRTNDDFGATWTITFLSNLGDLPLFVVDDDSLLKGTGVNVKILEVVQGVDVAFETIIQGLDPGQEYYVRAFARNENGYSTSTTDLQQIGRGALPLLTAVSTSPDPPSVNGMWPLSGSQLELRLSSPVDHGDPVSKYLIEYAVGESFGKVATKRVFVFSSLENDVTGTFRLQYGDDVTSLLSVHTTASALQRAFNSLPSVRPVSVTRALYVVVDGSGTSLSAANNRVTTAPLTALQCEMLTKGERIDVGGKRFIVRVQPAEGSTTIDVEPGHGVQDFTANAGVLKLDDSGTQHGPYGYEWTISFDNDVGDIIDRKYPGLQFISSLTSVTTSAALASTTFGIKTGQAAVSADHYGFFEVNSDERVCDTYVVGAPSSVQVVRLFAPTTATGGTFKLQLGSETTDCITLGNIDTPSTMKAKLEALELVSKVTVEEVRAFKVAVLSGSATSKVTDYDNTGELSVASPFTSLETGVLVENTIIQVSRNPNDFSRHSCEFIINTTPATGTTKISVSVVGSCEFFSNEARSLKILDFHDYQVRFWGQYPTRQWPTLQFDLSDFGAGICDPWTPANLPVYGQVHTIKYEGACSKGQAGIQTILADASSIIGGSFTLSYLGKVTLPLPFQYTGAAEMRDAIESITTSAKVRVSVSQYGVYGKAWHVTFTQEQEDAQDAIFIQHSRLTGQNAVISVYPTVTVFTDAKQDDISGSFRLTISGETTEAIGYSATHMKVVQELQKLTIADSVVALGDKTDDVGVYSLELTADATGGSKILTNIQLDGILIDPTRFLAIGETLEIGSNPSNTIQSMSSIDVTLTSVFPGTTASQNYKVLAGLITKQTIPLPGYAGITRLLQVIAVTKATSTFQLPVDHGFNVNSVFYVNGTKFTVTAVSGALVTTDVPYTGDNIVAASPKVYVFDNRLQTTEDWRNVVQVGEDLWLPSVSADMTKYTVIAIDERYIEVSGSFSDSITRTLVYHLSTGRKWNLVFRSYTGSLDTFDAVPEHDWRGTDARIGTRSPTALSPNVVTIGNPVSIQTILLEVENVGLATSYTLSFAGEMILDTGSSSATNIPWTTMNGEMKKALESLDSVDGVSVTSVIRGSTVIHTISFWGTYPMKTLPLLVVTPATTNLQASVHGNNAVAVTRQTSLILESSQAYAFRISAQNSRGISDSVTVFQAQTAAKSVVPTPPTGVALGEFHGSTWLSINYWAPVYSGGARVTMYRIEWDSSPSFSSLSLDYGVASIQEKIEVQQVTTSYRSSVGAGGTFTLSWGGHTTSALPFDCSTSDMTDAVAGVTDTSSVAVDPVKVTRTRVSWGFTWKITFLHNRGDLALLVADGTQLTGDFPQVRVVEVVQGCRDLAIGDFTHEVQEVFTDSVSPVAGSFTLAFNGKTTRVLDVSASALDMQAALQATSSTYSIKVTKAARNRVVQTAVWSVTFAYLRGHEMVGAGNIFTMTVAASQLTGTNAVVRVANKVIGSDPFRFTLTGLRPGVRYFAHVMAYNADGFGSATSPLASAVTCGQPPPPLSVVASVVDGTTLAVTWGASAVDGHACSVDQYKVEWYRAEGTQEQQTITTSASKGLPEIQRLRSFADSRTLSGYFKLSFGGETTENLRWDAEALGLNSVKERLERLSTIGTVDVSRTTSIRVSGLLVTANGTTVTWHTASSATIAETKLAKDDIIWIAGNERILTAVLTTTSFTIDTDLEVTIPVPVFKSAYGYEWQITFLAGHIGPQQVLQVSPSDSWTGNNPGLVVDVVQKGLQPISGTFRLAFASGGLSDTTPALPHDSSAMAIQTALENLVTIGAVNVTRSANGYGYNWAVTFLSEFKNDVSLLRVDGTELQGPGARVLTARTFAGSQPSFYCERDGVAGAAVELPPGTRRYVIPGLQTGQPYAVRVRAHNEQGYGYAASSSPVFQTPRTTSSVPQDVELLVLSSKSLKLRWLAPLTDGGTAILSYRIQWDTSSTFANVNTPNYDFQTVVKVSATDAGPYFYNLWTPVLTTYYVRILAMNDQGDGVYGLPVPKYARPMDRTPGRVENATATVLSSYAILVEWEASSTDKFYYGGDGGLPITQYMIEWDPSPAFDSPAAFGLVDGTERSFLIGGDDAVTGVRSDILVAGSSYSLRITAFNAKGSGAPRLTVPSSVVVTNQPPSAPQNLTLRVESATSVKAKWTNPLFDGGSSLKSYKIQWDEQEDFSSGQSASTTIPIVREMQSVVLQSDVVNEEQFVEVTVEVVNEEQEVRSTFTGMDEIQVITTSNEAVRDEVQKVVTSAQDINEIQELRLDDDDVDEIQAIRTTISEGFEVQDVTIGVQRVNEVQNLTLEFPGGVGNTASITGTVSLTFDTSVCTYCPATTKQSADTADLLVSIQETIDTTAAGTVKAELEKLVNIDTVDVSRTTIKAGTGTTGDDLTYIYWITFTGNDVGGDVALLTVGGTLTFNGNVIVPVLREETPGNELTFDSLLPAASSFFSLVYTCESYSDPNAASTFSAACTPTDLLCASCVTDFNGLTFTVTGDLSQVTPGSKLIAGVCSFEAHVVTLAAGTITLAPEDPGVLCSPFTGATFSLYRAPQIRISSIPVKSSVAVAVDGSDVQTALNVTDLLDATTVERTLAVTSDFVGAIYSVTFTKRTGKIPLLECDESNLIPSQAGTNVTCLVTRKTTGSMLTGTFKVGLVSQEDTDAADTNAAYSDAVTEYSAEMPWDVSESMMENVLGAVTDQETGTSVFGTVQVRRSAYSASGNKWSGGFTWQMTFKTRGWDIPTIKVVSTGLGSSDSMLYTPQVSIGDATHALLNPSVACTNGNQVGGTMTFSFGSVTDETCTIGVDTSLEKLDEEIRDTAFESFFQNSLKIPSIIITRSAASQARGFNWTIEFIDDSTPGDLDNLELVTQLTSTTGSNNGRTIVNEIQKGNELAGAFQLVFNGETTGPILATADATAVQAQLNSLRTIKPSSVIVSRGSPTSSQVFGYTWFITFRSSVWADPTMDHSAGIEGNWKGAAAAWDDVWESGYSKAWGRHVGHTFLLTCDKSSLVTTIHDGSQSCVTDVVTEGVGPLAGSFSVSLDSRGSPHLAVRTVVTSDPIAHNAVATKQESGQTGTSVEEILERMANVGDVDVSRSMVDRMTGGYEWTVTFLRDASDATHPCEQLEPLGDGTDVCNSPGDLPEMTTIETLLKGSTQHATASTRQDGAILRGDFTSFQVLGDAGVAQRYSVRLNCANAVGTSCTVTTLAIASGADTIASHLLVNDRFIVGTITSCVFQVVSVSPPDIHVQLLVCDDLNAGNTATALGISILVPWNGDGQLVQRVLEASATGSGRKVSVEKRVHGRYGDMSWRVRFISNPSSTPPGAGDIPAITASFASETTLFTDPISVLETTKGSEGLSGSFTLDFHSSFGPRAMAFNEEPTRMEQKINEMDTIGRVTVQRMNYPSVETGCMDSLCSGGWDDVPVENSGTRGGFRWRIRFLRVTGEHEGVTFPPGSGNLDQFTVNYMTSLHGNGRSIAVYTDTAGSLPLLGSFALSTANAQTPLLLYSSTAEAVKQGIEAMDLVGEVDVTQGYLLTQKLPGVTAKISRDAFTATISGVDDIREYLSPTDPIRFGSSSIENLVGSNGDAPFTALSETSVVTVSALSPIVVAVAPASTKLLYPAMQLRIDGLPYEIQRSGHEIQTLTAAIPTASWTASQHVDYYGLTLSRAGVTYGPTGCLTVSEQARTLQTALFGLLLAIDVNSEMDDVLVSRSERVVLGTKTGYVYSVYFLGDAVAGDVATLQPTSASCTGVADATVTVKVVTQGGNLPHQRLSLATDSGQVLDTNGYYKMSLDGKETDCILWGAPASDLKEALETTLSTGKVLVTRRGGGSSQTELQRLRMTAEAEVTSDSSGLFQLQFTHAGATSATNCIRYGVSALELQKELNSLSNLDLAVDHINVTRDGDGSSTWGFGYEYLIHFRGPVTGGYSPVIGDVPLLQVVNVGQSPCSSTAVGGHPALIMETVRHGSPGYTYDVYFMEYTTTARVAPIWLQHEGEGSVCMTGWVSNGGSVRRASMETIEAGGSSDVQVLIVKDKTATDTFQLIFGGKTTTCVAFSAGASVLESALNALDTIGSDGVFVARDTDVNVVPNGYIYRVTFVGDLVTGKVPLLTVRGSNAACTIATVTTNVVVTSERERGRNSGAFALTTVYNGEAPGARHVAYSISQQFRVRSEQFEVQRLIVVNTANDIAPGATYTLSVQGQTTASLAWDASERAMETALAVSGMTAGDITVTRRTDSTLALHGFVYTIYFSGASVTGDIASITKGILTSFGSGDVVVSTIRDGIDGAPSFFRNSIPLARLDDPTVASSYLASATSLDVFKVNGFLWTIKFKSALGNLPQLGKQTKALAAGTLTVVDDFIAGSASNSYVTPNLLAGITYHVHVAALTDIGTGPFTASSFILPSGAASAVQNIAAGYALYEHEVQEIRLAASHVIEIQEITTEAASIAEVQTLRTFAAPSCATGGCIQGSLAFRVPTVQTVTIAADATITSGTFTLTFTREEQDDANLGSFKTIGAATAAIPWNADAKAVKDALTTVADAAVTADDVVVSRDGDASEEFDYGYVFQITFVGPKVAGETSLITCQRTFVTTGSAASRCAVTMPTDAAMGTDTAVQQVIVAANKPLVAGSYSLEFTHLGAPKTSACIPFDASASTMRATLEAMSNIDKVYVTRERDAMNALNGFVYHLFFHGNGVYGDVNRLRFIPCTAFQTQEKNALTTVGVDGKVEIEMVDYGGFNAANTFVDAASATAAQLTTDLDRLPVFRSVLVSQSLVDEQGGYLWTVAFKDSEGDLPQFICAVDAAFQLVAGAGCETDTLTDGNVLSGTFLLEASSPIPFNADAGTMKTALEAMSWVGTVQVKQSAPSPQLGYTWTITFLDYRGDVPTLQVTSSLVGTGSRVSVREVRKGNALGGTFTLSYQSVVTAPIDWNALETATKSSADGSSMQEKLEALDVVGRVNVERVGPDQEGGYAWMITFLDNILNSGDLPLLQGNASGLTGEGVVVFTKEVRKGSNAVGDQLWLSFDPPATDNGSPITKYQVRWDTSSTFKANPADVFISDADIFYRTQRITTNAPSLAWSKNKLQVKTSDVQKLTILTAGTFTLKFRGVETVTLTAVAAGTTAGATTMAGLKAALEALSSVGSVDISAVTTATVLAVNAEFQLTFTTLPGALPLIQSSDNSVAFVVGIQTGATNFRKEVVVFTCTASQGMVRFTSNGEYTDVAFNAALTDVETSLLTLFGVEAESISVSSAAQSVLCKTATSSEIKIVFDRVYADINLSITKGVDVGADAAIVLNTDASINGVYNDDHALTMSGTFQVGYHGQYTRPLNAESSADQLRYALEDLDTIQTVGVIREKSFQALPGKVDVTQGEIFVTCSAGETCTFESAAYGLPGYEIRIGGDWYTVRTDLNSPGLHPTRLYLGDLNGREVAYRGATQTRITVYEWTKGYVWIVDLLSVTSPLSYIRAKVPRLYPVDAIVRIHGDSCDKCYYLPSHTSKTLITGQQYYIQVYAYNANGKGESPEGAVITATPRQVPDAPSNVDLLVVSGHEIEVFFSPPSLAASNMSPKSNTDISSYIVQWDVDRSFKHGLVVCTACAKALTGIVLTVTKSLSELLSAGSEFTILELGCVLEVSKVVSSAVVQVTGSHSCENFNNRVYSLAYYVFPPVEVAGARIQGSPPFRYLISNLVVGTNYYVRVAAVNSVPVQQIALDGVPPDNRKWSSPLAVVTKDRAPDAPLAVELYPYSGTILLLQVQPSTRDGKGTGGAAIAAFWIDLDTVSTFDSATKNAPIEVLLSSGSIPELFAGGPRIYYLTGLTTGTRYFAQVKAKNSVGYSRARIAPAPVAPTRHADGPINAKVTTLTSSSTPIESATVTWQKPAFNGGLGLTSYKIEWWRAQSRPEVQVIELKWLTMPTVLPFALSFRGGKSEYVGRDVSAENLRSALMNIAAGTALPMGHVEVSRSTINNNLGYQWTVTFANVDMNAGDQPLLQLEIGGVVGSSDVTGRVFELTSGIIAPSSTTFPGKMEVQVLVSYHATKPVGGYFRLGYKGSAWTNYLPATISAANLKLALEALPTIGVVNVKVEAMAFAGNAFNYGNVWTITYLSNVGNLPSLTVEPSKLTPADAFLGVKDGDNTVDGDGVLCLPGSDLVTCPGSWPAVLGSIRQQGAPHQSVVELAVPGEAAVDYTHYETLDAATLTYTIAGLKPGQAYFVAVTAKNAHGLGVRSQASPTSIIPPLQVPGPPTSVSVDVNPGVATQLVATWTAPISDGGSAVRMYRIEYDPSPLFTNRGQQDAWCPVAPTLAVWRVETVRTSAVASTSKIANGYFHLQLTRLNAIELSAPIPWDAVATTREEVGSTTVTSSKVFCTISSPTCTSNANFPFGRLERSGSMQSKLNALTRVTNGVDVQRSVAPAADGGYTWSITFLDPGDSFALAAKTIKLTCADPTLCTSATYDVIVTKVRAGVLPPSCVGSRVVPSVGALNKGQLYNLRVSAYNEVGFGKPGVAPNPQKPMVVPGPATAVTLAVYSVSELVLLFSPPDDSGGDTVTDYEIQYALDSVFTTPTSVVVAILTGMSAPYRRVLSSLTKGTPYFVRIRAKNSQGYGQFQLSSPTKMQPYTTPSAPTQVALGITSATMLTVRWAPPSDDGGDTISAYVVQWDVAAGFDSLALTTETTATLNDPGQRSYTITGLTPGTLYYVRVYAKNRGGQGTPQTSTPSSLVPAVTYPGKPNSLTMASTLVYGELRVTWQAPVIPYHGYPCAGTLQSPGICPVVGGMNMVYGGVQLDRYVIQYSEKSDFSTPSETTTASSIVTAVLTGLASGKTYYVQVLAQNTQGLRSYFCKRADTSTLRCPDHQMLLDGTVVTGNYVFAAPL